MKKIHYYSTNGHPELLDFEEALLRGQAPDRAPRVTCKDTS
ncbi:MAG: hypothetical protein WBK88_07740 [Methanothrix sp.]